MEEYKTLEQQIIELWKSRGLAVETIRVSFAERPWTWTITAKPEEDGEDGGEEA